MSEWISVEDELPQLDVPVLGRFGPRTIEGVVRIDGGWMFYQDGDAPLDPPTHWMPLPAPPVKRNSES